MSAIVTSPVSPKRPAWQPGHIPRLSYRNPIPAGESLPEHSSTKTSKRVTVPALSIREIREALPRETTPVSSPTTTQPQKGKKSFLGSIFVKEPSMAALDLVAQNMMQQHNAASTKSIPYISQQKMPNHVPKVNSKWDGVPDYVKTREKQERERTKAARRISLLPTVSRSRSGDIEQHMSRQRRNSNEGSTAESWDSRSTDSRPMFQDGVSVRPASIYSTCSDGSLKLVSRPFSEKSQSSGSFSGTKSFEACSLHPNETYSLSSGLQRMTSSQSASTKMTMYTNYNQADHSPRIRVYTAEPVPDYTSSPVLTPLESSPRTPGFFQEDGLNSDVQILNGTPLSPIQPQMLSVHVGTKKEVGRSTQPDTDSNVRQHSNTVDRKNIVPWETHESGIDNKRNRQPSRSKGRISGNRKK